MTIESEHKENSSFVPVPRKGTFVPVSDDEVEVASKAIYEHKPYLNHSGKSHMAWSVYKRELSGEYEHLKVAVRIGLEAAATTTSAAKGTFVRASDLADIIALLDEARGFAAMSPGGRDNITFAIDRLEDAEEVTYRKGFVDGEQHSAEYDSVTLDRMLDEAVRRMNQPKILGFDAEKFPIDNPEYLPNSDTQIGVEFAIEFLSSQTKATA